MAGKFYQSSMLEDHPAWEPAPVPTEVAQRATEAGWPPALLERLRFVRLDWEVVSQWLDTGFPTLEMIEEWTDQQEQLLTSTLTVRQAGWNDNEVLVDLCDHSPERAGPWDVTVERGPNATAQFRLQENAFVVLVEDRRVGLGMVSRSVRNTYVGGERSTVHFISGWRVRDGFRGTGISKLLLEGAGPGHGFFGTIFYWYVRIENDDRSWVDKVTGDMADRPEGWEVATDKLSATVTYFDQPDQGRPSPRVRPATEADLDVCCELINRTHDGLDLFRPYTPEFLAGRLDDPCWGPTPSFIASVYGWDDFRVVDIDGEVVACAGLWDRGRDLRERWRHRDDGREHVVEATALLDVGYAAGHEEAMAELLGHHLARTAELERTAMMASLEFLPDLAEACGDLSSAAETRELQCNGFTSPELTVEASITRPYTDLVYW